jgi:hypothetical protein
MKQPSNYALRLPKSLKAGIELAAKVDGEVPQRGTGCRVRMALKTFSPTPLTTRSRYVLILLAAPSRGPVHDGELGLGGVAGLRVGDDVPRSPGGSCGMPPFTTGRTPHGFAPFGLEGLSEQRTP